MTATITPEELLAALESAGFTEYQRVPAAYVRMAWPVDTLPGLVGGGFIIVPLDFLSPRYANKVNELLARLAQARAAGAAAGVVLSALGEP